MTAVCLAYRVSWHEYATRFLASTFMTAILTMYRSVRVLALLHSTLRTPCSAWKRALNARLPKDIRVVRSSTCDASRFDARRDALWRYYRYTIHTSATPSVFLTDVVWHYYQNALDVDRMHRAVRALVRDDADPATRSEGNSANTRDLSAFRKSKAAASHTNISVLHSSVTQTRADMIEVCIVANWFVYGMMRLLTAALVEVGRGEISVDDFRNIVRTGNRSAITYSAPAGGLCLMEVGYAQHRNPFRGLVDQPECVHLGLSDLVRFGRADHR